MSTTEPTTTPTPKRCSGNCCRVFFLPYDMATIQANPKRWCDGEMLTDMLIPLASSWNDLAPELQALIPFTTAMDGFTPDGPANFFTCKHHDSATGNCQVYETRPRMCREYPYDMPGGCKYTGCTMTGGCGVEKPPTFKYIEAKTYPGSEPVKDLEETITKDLADA